ncbi:MAG TPA: endonuclease MutS2 [Candidatus Ventrousia excrementavium]|uniref:Endonuclease MutS2 n=1 Tax=Candidatus Ventrousia excrementavium TaxID=2840961 RepID=A0A9D1IWL6_9CLOT|nr:endonuclease MutS2 [Candidatus Ventrousia excrementavium]
MTLQEKSLRTLELHKVLELLAEQTQTDLARERALSLRPETVLSRCELLQQQCADAVHLMGLFGSPSFDGVRDLSGALSRADMGGVLNMAELLAVARLLRAARTTRGYLENHREGKTSLDELFSSLSGNKYLEDKITTSIISEEEIADSASSELNDIRRQMRVASSRVRETLNRITSSPTYQKMLQDSLVTIRSGRYVVPVKAEYRSAFGGLVHDVSSSGVTLFIEPTAVVDLNNSIRVLAGKEQQEIERILAALSAEVAACAGAMQRDYETLCALDFIFARGKLAYKMKALRPRLSDSGKTVLHRARHPLLDIEKAVPIDFEIGGKCDTVIITGPNTGGKTVSIKTVGLLTVMAQCGLQIPAGEDSVVRLRTSVLADIGDEQSIEQSLSTFSSHMVNIVDILHAADSGALVLLDELGAGTDPVEGAALAMAIIEELRRRGSAVIATTHYAELKMYALETDGVENASCEFDVQTLRPTYRLVFGIPGKSNAFAIASRLGLDDAVIESANSRIGAESKRFEEVISQLEEKRQELEHRLASAERDRAKAAEAERTARERLSTLEGEREKLIMDAKLKAQEILNNARATSEYVLTEARRLRQQAEEGKDPNLAAARAAFRGQISDAERLTTLEKAKKKAIPPPRPLRAGDTVELLATKTRATVLETPAPGGNVRVQAGIMKITVRPDEIQFIEESRPKPVQAPKSTAGGRVPRPEGQGASLDLRGMTAEEAIMELGRFIDGAVRMHLPAVTIIHGKGTGVLRRAVQAELKGMPQVKSYRLGVYGEGEDGVTIATLE